MVYLKLVLTALFWGGTFVAGRHVSLYMGPFSAAFLRFLLAGLCMIVVTRRHDGALPKPGWKGFFAFFFLGLTGVFAYNAFFFFGLQTVPAGRAAVIVALNPIVIALLAALFFKERLTSFKVIGIFLSVSGAIFVITSGNPFTLFSNAVTWGDASIFGCVGSWAAYSLIGKRLLKDVSASAAVLLACFWGTLLLFFFAVWEGLFTFIAESPMLVFFSIGYLGLFGTVLGFTWYYEGVKSIGASRASVFINFVPVSAVILGFLVLSEPIHYSLLIGAVAVGIGVYLTNKPIKPAPTAGPNNG